VVTLSEPTLAAPADRTSTELRAIPNRLTGGMKRIGVLLAGLALAAGCATPASTPLPLSTDDVVMLAREHVAQDMDVVSVETGRFADLTIHRVGLADTVAAERLVWAVTFEGEFEICQPTVTPGRSNCRTARPGTTRVFLDHETKEFLESQSISPP
jgi:hypothetical protein